MRILILHNAYALAGGEDAAVQAEVEALRAGGHDVHLLVRSSAALHANPLRGAAETLLTVHNPGAAAELSEALRAFRPDVVHAHNLFPRWGLAALRVLLAHGVPAVQTLHNFRWLCAPATLVRDHHDCLRCTRGDFRSAIRFACIKDSHVISAAYALALAGNRATRLAERAFARFVCVSRFVREVHAHAGFAADKLTVVGHFLARTPGPEGAGDGSVIYAGRLSAEKGVLMLVRALAQLPDVVVKIAGEGAERAALEAALAASPARVRLLGHLPRAALEAELRRSSVCVVPSIGSETFGLSALEAFGCGRPVVCTDAGGLPEVVSDGEDGWVVPRNDAAKLADRIRWLLAHPERAREMGERGRSKVVCRHSASAHVIALEAVYRSAMSRRPGAAEPPRVGVPT